MDHELTGNVHISYKINDRHASKPIHTRSERDGKNINLGLNSMLIYNVQQYGMRMGCNGRLRRIKTQSIAKGQPHKSLFQRYDVR